MLLVYNSQPDIPNSVRELSKVAYGATEGHLKAELHTIYYFIDT
jgi:hypothetical protein